MRDAFNAHYQPELYLSLLDRLNQRAGTKVEFRVAETPVFLPKPLLEEMAEAGARLTHRLLGWPEYMAGARASIPEGFFVAGDSDHPNFVTADFALVAEPDGN